MPLHSDVSRCKGAAHESAPREQELRSIVANTPDIIARFDRDLRHVFISQAIERETGVPPAAFVGLTPPRAGLAHDRGPGLHHGASAGVSTGDEEWMNFTLPTPDGERHYECRIIPERDADEHIVSVLSVARNVSGRNVWKLALQESEARFRHLVEQPLAGIYILRQDRLSYVNPLCTGRSSDTPPRRCLPVSISRISLSRRIGRSCGV